MHILYMLTFSNGKIYIGQTVRTMQTRLAQHRQSSRNGSKLPVHCAWRSHGEPVVKVLAEFGSPEELHAAEIATINALNTLCPNGYNLGRGGETAPSKNPDVAKKISESAQGRKYVDTTPWSKASTALWENDEYRKKVSDGLKAGWTEERKEIARKRIMAMWAKRKEEGWEMPESQKQKMRYKVFSPETRAKMSAASKGKPKGPRTEETGNKISKNVKESWKDPEIRAKRLAAMKAAKLKKG
jgi:hypothetical protein